MFIAELFIVAKEPNNPSVHQMVMTVRNEVHEYNGVLFSNKKNKLLR